MRVRPSGPGKRGAAAARRGARAGSWLPTGADVEVRQVLHLAALQHRDRYATVVQNAIGGERRHALARRHDAHQVEWIGGADRHHAAGRRVARLAQHRNGLRQGELLAGETGHETAAADLAARFEATVHTQHVAPGRQLALPLEHAAEDNAVATHQNASDFLGVVPVGGVCVACSSPIGSLCRGRCSGFLC